MMVIVLAPARPPEQDGKTPLLMTGHRTLGMNV